MLDSILVYKYVQFFTYISLIWDNWIKVKLLPSSSYCLTNFDFPPKLQVAEIIKEDLWPNPLKYFNNVLLFLISFFIIDFHFHSVHIFCLLFYRNRLIFQVTLFYCFRKLMKRILMQMKMKR